MTGGWSPVVSSRFSPQFSSVSQLKHYFSFICFCAFVHRQWRERIDIERLKNRLLKFCYVPVSSAAHNRLLFFSFLLWPFTVLMKQTMQAVHAIKQSIIFLVIYDRTEQNALKNVNNHWNTNIYSCLETSGACTIKLLCY